MNGAQLEEEARILERIAQYRIEYERSRAGVLDDERERRHAAGEVYFAGGWVPRAEAGNIARALQRREYVAFFETLLLLAFSIAVAAGFSSLFAFLFLP